MGSIDVQVNNNSINRHFKQEGSDRTDFQEETFKVEQLDVCLTSFLVIPTSTLTITGSGYSSVQIGTTGRVFVRKDVYTIFIRVYTFLDVRRKTSRKKREGMGEEVLSSLVLYRVISGPGLKDIIVLCLSLRDRRLN